jgi:DNA-binding transcriptional LysR family regulator
MDRLDTMEAFVRVAESRSFSAAARRLGLSKSVISRQVSALEAQLGARLFHRTTRSLSLTEVGIAYFDRCSRILADIEEANLSISQLQTAPRGKLRVNAPMTFGVLHLAPLLPEFMRLFPTSRSKWR